MTDISGTSVVKVRIELSRFILCLGVGSACLLIDLYWINSFLNFTSLVSGASPVVYAWRVESLLTRGIVAREEQDKRFGIVASRVQCLVSS